MRGFVLVLFASVPLFGGTVSTSATCDGNTSEGSDAAGCGVLWSTWTSGASAQASLTEMYVTASASTGWDIPDSSSATASLSQDFILTVTGGQGDGYAETELGAYGGNPWSGGQGWGSESLGGCNFWSGDDVNPPEYCQLAFVFGVPQTLTLSESAGASVGPYSSAGTSGGAGMPGYFTFFSDQGQPLSGVTYTLVPGEATPEPLRCRFSPRWRAPPSSPLSCAAGAPPASGAGHRFSWPAEFEHGARRRPTTFVRATPGMR
jgi:hypothetical protein